MATLSIPHSFVPGTPALASEVNANFQAVVSWTQGQISTDNFGILGARSVALPSSPTLAILSLAQTSSNIALNINNSGTESAIAISQSGALANGKGAILINSPSNQTTSGAAELLMTLNTNSSIPAILVNHGVTPTMNLTRTQLSLFNGVVQATSAGVLSATTANLTNANTTGLITATAPVSDALAIKIKGRSSDNTAVVQFKSNDDATVYASATSSASGLTLNLPDTSDSYIFQVNGIAKGVIDNNGIDGQYLKTGSVTTTKILNANVTEPKVVSFPYLLFNSNYGPNYWTGGTYNNFFSGTITISNPRNLLILVQP